MVDLRMACYGRPDITQVCNRMLDNHMALFQWGSLDDQSAAPLGILWGNRGEALSAQRSLHLTWTAYIHRLAHRLFLTAAASIHGTTVCESVGLQQPTDILAENHLSKIHLEGVFSPIMRIKYKLQHKWYFRNVTKDVTKHRPIPNLEFLTSWALFFACRPKLEFLTSWTLSFACRPTLADSGGGAAGGGGAQGARAPPFEIPKRVFKRDPPKTFAPAALAVAAAPPLLSTNPGSAPDLRLSSGVVWLSHSAHLGHFRRLPPPSEIRLGRNGQFWDICDAARMNTGVNRQAEGRHSAR